MNKLYHKDVYWEDWFNDSAKSLITLDCNLSNHLWKHISEDTDDRYDIDLTLLYFIVKRLTIYGIREKTNRECIYEVEVSPYREVSKCVVRCIYDKDRDISIVFRKGLIITCWLNSKFDFHKNLDKTKYEIK